MDGIAFDPCHKCDKSISCGMCELYMRRNGLLQRTSDEQIFDGEMTTADVVPRSNEGAECPVWHGTGRIGTSDWLTKHISAKQLAKEKAEAVAEYDRHLKSEVAREIFEEIENIFGKHMLWYRFTEAQYQLYVELKKKYTEGTDGKQA